MAAFAGKSQSLSKAEYLKRYLETGGNQKGDDVAPKAKKKKKRKPEGKGLRIVDDDADDWKKEPTKVEEVLEDEDEPVVAEFVDERPQEVKIMEEFRTSNKWKLIQDESPGLEKEAPESRDRPEITTSPKRTHNNSPLVSDSSPPQKERHDGSPRRGRHDSPGSSPSSKGCRGSSGRSSPCKNKHGSSAVHKGRRDSPDLTPPRKGRHDSPDLTPPRKGRHDSPDLTPPRKGRRDSPDLTPPRKGGRDSPDLSPPRKGRRGSPDLSPPRKGRRGSPDLSPPRKGRRGSPDLSPPRKGRRGSPDLSPPRKGRRGSPDLSPPRKGRSDSHPHRDRHKSPNNLPTRRGKHDSPGPSYQRRKYHSPGHSYSQKNRHDSPELSPKHNRTTSSQVLRPSRSAFQSSVKHNADSDLSPPRKKKAKSPGLNRKKQAQQRQDSDSDLSPPRHTQRRESDSDLSPPRRSKRNASDSDLSPPRISRKKDSDSDLSPPRRRNGAVAGSAASSSKKDANSRMLSGGRVGLISAEVLREENEELRKAQKDNKHLEDDSMRAETVFRDKSGKRRDLKAEREEQHQKQAIQDKKAKQYAEWAKGLAQKEQQQQNLQDAAREVEKPLARYADDADLDQMLREREREGDPMAKFLQKKKEKENTGKKARPRYKGTNPPPNRYNIWPGYRWDGVDRSNGFEKQYFARQSDKKSMQEAAYKWSVEDM